MSNFLLFASNETTSFNYNNNNYNYNYYYNKKSSAINNNNSNLNDSRLMKKSGKYESERKISNDNIKKLNKQSFDILKEFAICNNLFIIQNKEPVDNNKIIF